MRFFSGRISTRKPTRQAFTLIEILIATTVTLMMMAALSVGFKRLGDGITEGRAKLNLTDRLRSVTAILRNDLESMTAHPDPTSAAESVGYFEYYDGPLTDYSAAVVAPAANRFGDADDILMFTARAGNDWYRGKVPLALLKAVQNSRLMDIQIASGTYPSPPFDSNQTPLDHIYLGVDPTQDWKTPVVIASEYAEIVYFLQPRRQFDSPLLLGSPTDSVIPSIDFLDNDQNGLPDEYLLHRRVLLIRPDLNIFRPETGVELENELFSYCAGDAPNPSPPYFERVTAIDAVSSPSGNMLGMRFAHTNCDLSIRRKPNSGDSYVDEVAANSLEDLRNPENRFGHFVAPVLNASTSMPILALGNPIPAASGTIGLVGPGSIAGFLHPYFELGEYVRVSDGGVTSRRGQDILAANVLGFDIRGFDPSVALLFDGGADGEPGVALVDDDSDGVVDNNDAQEYGLSGTDDLVLSPSDPGYSTKIFAPFNARVRAGFGAFVDLNWGPKAMMRGDGSSSWSTLGDSDWFTPLSGFSQANTSALGYVAFTSDLYKSGKIWHREISSGAGYMPFSASSDHFYQPTYDSWTNNYEVDGRPQKKIADFLGNIWINHQNEFGIPGSDSWDSNPNQIHRSFTQVDSGTDGLDNDLTGGPDDVLERETSSPYPFIMPAVQVTVRMEDAGTRLVQQMSVVYDFISQ
jgi:Prokaryotic N-terminal methylation motif